EKSMLHNHEAIDALLQKALDQMKSQGAIIVEVDFMSKYQALGNKEFSIMKYEFKDGLNRYLASSNSKMKSLEDVIKFDKENEATAMPYFKQEIMDSSQITGDIKSKGYAEAMTGLPAIRKFLDDVLTKNHLDALCGPSTGPSWTIDLIAGDHWTGYGAYGPAAMAGYPSITVPMGLVMELPVGISFLGRPYDEPGLISIAYAYEQASKNWAAPKYLPSFPSK
ncbi:MAG: amidase family protein, partial [Saprospiraceae bacterium]